MIKFGDHRYYQGQPVTVVRAVENPTRVVLVPGHLEFTEISLERFITDQPND